MIIGIMLFKQVLNNTTLWNQFHNFCLKQVSVYGLLYFLFPLIGFLTGIGVGFVGVSFPLFYL